MHSSTDYQILFLKDLFDYMPMREEQDKSLVEGIEQLAISKFEEDEDEQSS